MTVRALTERFISLDLLPGRSRSAYSLASQSDYEPTLFASHDVASGADMLARAAGVASFVQELERRHGLVALADIVLNHTADNSAWLADHPEAVYTVANTPHLALAYALDTALRSFSSKLAAEQRNRVDARWQIDALVDEFFDRYLDRAALRAMATVEQASEGGARRASFVSC